MRNLIFNFTFKIIYYGTDRDCGVNHSQEDIMHEIRKKLETQLTKLSKI